jgi:hypothetical protein
VGRSEQGGGAVEGREGIRPDGGAVSDRTAAHVPVCVAQGQRRHQGKERVPRVALLLLMGFAKKKRGMIRFVGF